MTTETDKLLKQALDKFVQGFAKQVDAGNVRMDNIVDLEHALKIAADLNRVYRQGRLDKLLEHVKRCPVKENVEVGQTVRELMVTDAMLEWLDALKDIAAGK